MTAHYVYRMYTGDRLGYVGCTKAENLQVRIGTHCRDKAWAGEVTAIIADEYPTRAEARVVEAEAIRTEFPRFNLTHNGGDRARWTIEDWRDRIVGAQCSNRQHMLRAFAVRFPGREVLA